MIPGDGAGRRCSSSGPAAVGTSIGVLSEIIQPVENINEKSDKKRHEFGIVPCDIPDVPYLRLVDGSCM